MRRRHNDIISTLAGAAVLLAGLHLAGCSDDDCTKTLTCERSSTGDGGSGAGGGSSSNGGAGATSTSVGGAGGDAGLPDGEACGVPGVCASGLCVDGACCATACDGGCESCGLSGTEGTCTPHPAGTNPEDVCGAASSCNGDAFCGGEHVWSQSIGDDDDDRINDVAVDSQGNIIICGSFHGSMQVGGTTLNADGTSQNAFVAKLDPNGDAIWAKEFGTTDFEDCVSVAVGPQDTITIAGGFGGSINLGGSTLPNGNVFVGRFSSQGVHQWSVELDGAGDVDAIAVDSTGAVYGLGWFVGTVDFGDGPVSGVADFDIYLVKLDDAGSHDWHKIFADGGFNSTESGDVTVDGADNVIVVGVHNGAINYGGGAISGDGVFVAKYSAAGAHVFSDVHGVSLHYAHALATDADENIYVGGKSQGSLSFGGAFLDRGAYVAKLNPSGAHLWSQSYEGSSVADIDLPDVLSLALTSDGGIVAAGRFGGTMDVGGVAHDSEGDWDAFFIRASPSGEAMWSSTHGDNARQQASVVAATLSGFVAGGYGAGALDFGGGAISQHGADDAFVTVFRP